MRDILNGHRVCIGFLPWRQAPAPIAITSVKDRLDKKHIRFACAGLANDLGGIPDAFAVTAAKQGAIARMVSCPRSSARKVKD